MNLLQPPIALLLLLATALLLCCRPAQAMNKAELIDAMASNANLSKADAKRALDGFMQSIANLLKKNGEAYVGGLGAFKIASDEVCDGLDNDCNGRFFCDSGEKATYSCGGGTVCNGVDRPSGFVIDGNCSDNVDEDCDAIDDDSDGDSIELYAVEDVVARLGKFYGWYWMDVVMELANELDVLAGKSYSCDIIPEDATRSDGAGQVTRCTLDGVILEEMLETNPLHQCSYIDTVMTLMRVIEKVLVVDPKDESGGEPAQCRDFAPKKGTHGHVTVLKCALLGDGNTATSGIEELIENCALGPGLQDYVENFLRNATDALTEMNNPLDDEPTKAKADRQSMVQWIAKIFQRNESNLFTKELGNGNTNLRPPAANDPSYEKASAALDSIIEIIISTMSTGDRVSLVGFGSFSISRRAARTGRNPQTGATIKIAPKTVAKFKAGKALADTVKAFGGGGGGGGGDDTTVRCQVFPGQKLVCPGTGGDESYTVCSCTHL